MKSKHALLVVMLSLCVLTAAAPMLATAAGGTNGNITMSTDTAVEGQNLVIKCYNLDVSSDYSLEVDDTVKFNWTTSASETVRYLRISVPAGGADGMVKVELVNNDVTVIDTKYIQSSDPADLVPEDMLTDLFTAIIVIVVFAGIILGLMGGFIAYNRR